MFNPDLIGTRTAAEVLGVSVATVTRWAKSGRLVPVATLDSGALVFSLAAVRKLADSRACA